MITLTLLHPVQGTAVQSWTFKNDQTVRIGRAVDNEVVLYSAVVSRYHVEVRYENAGWYIHNIGINGTFIDGRKIESEPLNDGKTFRLARSGPNIKVTIESAVQERRRQRNYDEKVSSPLPAPHRGTQIESQPIEASNSKNIEAETSDSAAPNDSVEEAQPPTCQHERATQSSLICIDCGEPMNVLKTIGSYKVLKSLGDRNTTFQAWKNKKTYILRTAPEHFLSDPNHANAYRQYLDRAAQLNHGGIPRIIEVCEFEDQPYLIYEMVYGIALDSWVKERGPLSLPSGISWITEIARVLEYLHQLESPFIHQGVRPSNIIRPTIPQGNHHLLLVNFGQIDPLISQTDHAEPDLAYRSPNLAKGEMSIEADLYGLGATFLFMLTGCDPYKYIQLGDKAYHLQPEENSKIPPKAWNLIGSLLRTEDCVPIETVTQAIDQFLHLI